MAARRGRPAAALGVLFLVAACATAPPGDMNVPAGTSAPAVNTSAPALTTSIKPQSPQQTRIYVLRDPEVHSELAYPGIKIDDQSIGDLAPAKFLFADRAPGQHVVAVYLLHNYYPLTLTTRPGSVHYVRLTLRPAIETLLLSSGLLIAAAERAATGRSGAYILIEMSEAEGRALMQKLMAGGSEKAPERLRD
jgi:hypothetical protein